MRTRLKHGVGALLGGLLAGAVAAAPAAVEVAELWSRATAPGAANGAVFMTLQAAGADRLLAAESPVAVRVELHAHQMDGGVARMRAVPALVLPAGTAVTMKPGGLHVMLLGLKAPLVAGTRFPLRLRFEQAGAIDVEVAVGEAGAMRAAGETHGHPAAAH